jgi:hypothetical protein
MVDKRINSYTAPKTTEFRGKRYKKAYECSSFIEAEENKKFLKTQNYNVILATIKDKRMGGYKPVLYSRKKK